MKTAALSSLFFAQGKQPPSLPARIVSFLLGLAALGGVITLAFASLRYEWDWAGVGGRWRLYRDGLGNTLRIAAFALPLSTGFAVVLALCRRCSFLPLRYVAQLYVEIIRCTPLLVQIYIVWYGLFEAVKLNNRLLGGGLILAGFSAAYLSEIIRAGLDGVGKSQLESARAIGLTTVQTYRHVIFPQAIRQILPGLAGQFVSLVKDSSLLSIIAINEVTQAAGDVNAVTYKPFESYLPLAAVYLLLTLPISLWAQRLERRTHFDT